MPNIRKYLTIKIDPRQYTQQEIDEGVPGKFAESERKKYFGQGYENVKVAYKILPQKVGDVATIDNPIKDAPKGSAFAFKTEPTIQYYLRFGYLLEYIRDNILLKVKIGDDHFSNPPIFDIDRLKIIYYYKFEIF
jgi:hypothetical protein